jgi:hypothetical protein
MPEMFGHQGRHHVLKTLQPGALDATHYAVRILEFLLLDGPAADAERLKGAKEKNTTT